jgi:ribosomal protein S18 acetylase RimI-like enzyme
MEIEICRTDHRDRIANVDSLDNPVWHALVGAHRTFALGDGGARRYDPDVAPFAALPDDPSADDWRALGDLVPARGGEPGDVVVLFRAPLEPPEGWETLFRARGVQMLAPDDVQAGAGGDGPKFDTLGREDIEAMLALVERTRPGPFRPRTVELGRYLGLHDDDGALIGMAGERLRVPGLVEISAVCTAPEYQGGGIGTGLVRAVAASIGDSGDAAFLHVADDNVAAIRLYEKLGFTTRATLDIRALRQVPH